MFPRISNLHITLIKINNPYLLLVINQDVMNIKIGVVDLRIVHFADLTADFTIEFIADRAFLQDTHQIAGIRHFFT
ncbi:Uncharacterised protein [Vibrio cholerae]|nr:Uncharacterised protein [Vibrio cholerae]